MENPLSGTTDDVKFMFSIIISLTIKHFTLRQVKYTWRKACMEFSKRLDPHEGFYYFTSLHNQFYAAEHPHFDKKATKRVKSAPVRRREQPTSKLIGRATLPQPAHWLSHTSTAWLTVHIRLSPPPPTHQEPAHTLVTIHIIDVH